MDIKVFQRTRPFVFHVTRKQNLARILRLGAVESTKRLYEQTPAGYVATAPREEPATLEIGEDKVVVRDQEVLTRKGQQELEPGFSMTDLTTLLDSLIVFWPGNKDTKVDSFIASSRGADDPLVVLRVRLDDLIRANNDQGPMFSRHNSANRASGGKAGLRGPKLFVGAAHFDGNASDVKEIAFRKQVTLPDRIEVAEGPELEFKQVVVRSRNA